MKTCTKCLVTKVEGQFGIQRRRIDGSVALRASCKDCMKTDTRNYTNSTVGKAKRKEWDATNPEKRKRHTRRASWKRRGIDPDLAEAYYNEHHGKCEICGESPETALHMDHCHVTGKIRGMLCSNCNTGLGQFKDSPQLLRRAIEYLKTHTIPAR